MSTLTLAADERYVGPVLDDAGHLRHHLILLAERPETDVDWAAAKAWAEKVGGTLPDRQELALLFENCKAVLPQSRCWSSEPVGASCAWLCNFDNGTQSYIDQSYAGCAVAVRLIGTSHQEHVALTRALLNRGYCVNGTLTKIFPPHMPSPKSSLTFHSDPLSHHAQKGTSP